MNDSPRAAYLVEDEALIRATLIPALAELAGVEVLAFAETEAEAVDWLRARGSEAELVILDIFLKDGTGLGVLGKRGDFPPGCRIVVLTNSATPEIRARCLALGAEAVFDKTAEIDEFFDHCLAMPPRVH
jgi:two-component system OmpR family response regulator